MHLFSVSRQSPALRLTRILQYAAAVGAAALLVACGGGGGGGLDVADPGAPATPAGLTLGPAGIKTLNFKWDAVAGATHYKLFEDLDGAAAAAAPVEVSVPSGGLGGGMITGVSYGHEVPLYERLNATYTLKACNALGCSASSPAFQPSIANLNAAIGYAKATGGGVAGDKYGAAIAMSRDGQTLAVGVQFESTGASSSGAVNVMRRSSAGVWSEPRQVKDYLDVQSNEFFGRSLALSADGSVLAVGVPSNLIGANRAGSVQLFVFNPTTGAHEGADAVFASNANDNDGFGAAIALSDDGNVLAVGAPREGSAIGMDGALQPDDDSVPNAGAVYVYRRAGGMGAWANEQFIKASNASAGLNGGDQFGSSLALSGDGLTLAVGAYAEDSDATGIFTAPSDPALGQDLASNAGAVYVLSRAAVDVDFGNQVYIKASNSGSGDQFGVSVALSQNGSVLAVGAGFEGSSDSGVDADQLDNGGAGSGAVYVFVRDDAGVWSQQSFIKASNNQGSGNFGSAVALSSDGNVLAVGAWSELRIGTGLGADPLAGDEGLSRGAVYVLRRSAAGIWSHTAYLKSPTDANGSSHGFGSALALSGNGASLAVGSPFESNGQGPLADNPKAGAPAVDAGNADEAGAVYIF